MTPSTISQVEKSLIYPSLPALCRIAENLSVEVATLFKEHGERKNVYVYPVDSRSVTSLTKNVKDNAEADLLIPPDIDTPGEAIIRIRPGKKLPGHFFAHKGPELGYLLSGQLEMTVGNQSYKISPGDTIYLQKDIPGRWNNISEEVAELLSYVPHPGHSFFVFFPPSIYPSRSASDKFNAFRYRFCPSVSCVANRHMPATLTT